MPRAPQTVRPRARNRWHTQVAEHWRCQVDRCIKRLHVGCESRAVSEEADEQHDVQRSSGFPDHEQVLNFQASTLAQLLNPFRLARISDGEMKYGTGSMVSIPDLMGAWTKSIWTDARSGARMQLKDLNRRLESALAAGTATDASHHISKRVARVSTRR